MKRIRWKPLLSQGLNFVLENRCPLCQRSTAKALCPDCQNQLNRERLGNPQQFWQAPLPVFAWGSYGGHLKRMIALLKYENHPQLARPLGHWLGQAWLAADLAPSHSLVVVPVPLHHDKLRQRGFNQAELIARAFCEVTRLPLLQGLQRSRYTEAQFQLSCAARAENLVDAFQISDRLQRDSPARKILLLDDIYTTGATAQAVTQTLRSHQRSVVGLVAVAKTEYGGNSVNPRRGGQ